MTELMLLKTRIRKYALKYYLNLFLQRLFYGVAYFFLLFIIIQGLEYLFWLNTSGRLTLFLIYALGLTVFLIVSIAIPLLRVLGYMNTMGEKELADHIGEYFPDIRDKLRNILELQEVSMQTTSIQLLNASILQKYAEIRPLNFDLSINWLKTKRLWPLFLLPLILLISLSFTFPEFVKDSFYRIAHFNQEFIKPAPFKFVIKNKSLSFPQNKDAEILLSLVGESVPDEAFIQMGDRKIRMEELSQSSFRCVIPDVRKNFSFTVVAGGFQSTLFLAHVYSLPSILSYVVKADYPDYINKPDETFSNLTDLIVPHGTKIEIMLLPKDEEGITAKLDEKKLEYIKKGRYYVFDFMALSQHQILFSAWNNQSSFSDSLMFIISTIPDAYPEISIVERSDSILNNNKFFTGRIRDDYGLSRLEFRYKILDSDTAHFRNLKLNIMPGHTDEEFFHYFDFNVLGLKEGQKVEYYFIVWDNDIVGGPKSSRSTTGIYRMPTREEVSEMLEKRDEYIDKALENARKKLLEQQQEIEKLIAQTTGKRNMNYEDRENLRKLIEQQTQVQNELNELVKRNNDLNTISNEFNPYSEQVLEKQRQVEELFNQIANDEMQELMRQMEELIEKNKKGPDEMLQQMQLSNEDLLKQLERQMEMGKSLAVEKKLEDLINELNELSERQLELSEQNKTDEEALDKQQELNNQFKALEDKLDSLQKDNNELEMPFEIEKDSSAFEEITEDMEQSEQSISSGNSSKASKNQKSASDKMKSLAQKMSDMKESMNEEQLGEDIGVLRDMLESLIKSSFRQEELINDVRVTSASDPQYYSIMRNQKLLVDGFKVIEDSLFALSKRQPMIGNLINEEIGKIEYHSKKAMAMLQIRASNLVVVDQQKVMTSVNNLALLLAEALKEMQNAMNQQMSSKGNSQCKKGGNSSGPGKASARTMRQLQEQLNQQIQELGKKMSQGKAQGQGMGGYSEQLAKLAAQQEALRKMMEAYQQQLSENGVPLGSGGKEAMEKMEQTETDLVNKRITLETLQRQQEILTRLLESEKAEQEREKEEKRESEEAKFINNSNPAAIFKYNILNQNGTEILQTIPPSLNGFYRKKVNEYFYKLQ